MTTRRRIRIELEHAVTIFTGHGRFIAHIQIDSRMAECAARAFAHNPRRRDDDDIIAA